MINYDDISFLKVYTKVIFVILIVNYKMDLFNYSPKQTSTVITLRHNKVPYISAPATFRHSPRKH